MTSVVKGCVAEFIGMFLFVFFGCASIILMHSNPASSAGLATIALAHGLVMSALITGAMAISGGQFNPAVSIGLVVAGKQSPGQAAAFIVVQLVGAACAAGLLQLILTPAVANDESVRLGATIGSLTRSGDTMAVLGLEAVTSFALMYAVLMATVDSRAPKLGGLCIGLTIAACILAVGPLSGASMNPARTFGPAICGNHWDMHWVYWVGPVLGACVAAVVYRAVWEGKK